jgi:alpha-amylase/alpha-mannosidase (GH57 family)
MEMLFMLAWCGNYLRLNNKTVKTLLKKGKGFVQDDKAVLLGELTAFVQTILPFYAKLLKDEVISLSTTPYNHPILPLLLDMNNARRANEHTTLPDNPMALRDDAIEQVRRSIELFETTFGSTPTGFWPAEGAVDEESVGIYKAHGLKWIATDEAILFRSLANDDRRNLYAPYRFNDVAIGFRDHGLSDLIGFTYRFKAGHEAAEHFIKLLSHIAADQKDPTVFVILDGENAWEFFENNAYDFFTSLYDQLDATSWCNTVTMDEVSALPSVRPLAHLAPGSWIHGNFDTWSGHHEKNRAWELIYQTKRDVQHCRTDVDAATAEKVRYHFLAAECSDWFWWYGDDHVTDFAVEFDALFREHLIAIYHLLKMQPPSDLFEPILTHKSTVAFMFKPQYPIYPVIDGSNTTFFEWLGSGVIDETKLFSTMDRVRGPIEKIYYGHNEARILLALEGDVAALRNMQLLITVEESGKAMNCNLSSHCKTAVAEMAVGERIEIALERSFADGLSSLHLRLEIVEGDQIVQTLPGYGSLFIDLAQNFADNWFV